MNTETTGQPSTEAFHVDSEERTNWYAGASSTSRLTGPNCATISAGSSAGLPSRVGEVGP